MKTITIEVTTFELNELYEAIIYRRNQLSDHLEKVSKWDNPEKIVKVIEKRLNDLDNVHSKIAKAEGKRASRKIRHNKSYCNEI